MHRATSWKVAGSIADSVIGFSFDPILLAALWPELVSATNTNGSREYSCGVKGDRFLRLSTSPPSVNRLFTTYESFDVSHTYGSPWPVRRITSDSLPHMRVSVLEPRALQIPDLKIERLLNDG
jgi:hypothetical protein